VLNRRKTVEEKKKQVERKTRPPQEPKAKGKSNNYKGTFIEQMTMTVWGVRTNLLCAMSNKAKVSSEQRTWREMIRKVSNSNQD
jgi:hypothetical protein